MDEETWKKGEELIKRIPELKTNNEIKWREKGAGENFRLMCELLKANAIPTKELNLYGDEKWSKMKWIIIIIKKTKEWKNEMKNINDNENTKERDRNDKW